MCFARGRQSSRISDTSRGSLSKRSKRSVSNKPKQHYMTNNFFNQTMT